MSNRVSGRFVLGSFEVFTFSILSFLILLCTFDLARGLAQYVALNRLAEAGATYASFMPGLERGSFLSNVSTNPSHHVRLQSEIVEALAKLGIDARLTKVSTENRNDNSVCVKISSVFVPRFGLFKPIPMSVSFTGPYRHAKGVEV